MGTGFDGDLNDMFKHLNFTQGAGMNKMLGLMMRNAQISMLKQLRRSIDDTIKRYGTQDQDVPDPYEVLGVTPEAKREDIERAYKRKAFEVHPDRGGSQQEMIKVNAAYQAIKMMRGWSK